MYYLVILYRYLKFVYKPTPMTNKMLQFVDIGQQNPPKRDKSQRKEDFG